MPLPPLSLLLFSSVVSLTAAARGAVEFNRDIRPLLTQHCTACHGGVKTAGGASFVYREKALVNGVPMRMSNVTKPGSKPVRGNMAWPEAPPQNRSLIPCAFLLLC